MNNFMSILDKHDKLLMNVNTTINIPDELCYKQLRGNSESFNSSKNIPHNSIVESEASYEASGMRVMLSLVSKIKDRTITPDEIGMFHNASLSHYLNYPNIDSYPLENKIQVFLSTFRKIGLVDSSIPYRPVLDFIKQHEADTFESTLNFVERAGVISAVQRKYLTKALALSTDLSSDKLDKETFLHQLNIIGSEITQNSSLSTKEQYDARTFLSILKHSNDFWQANWQSNNKSSATARSYNCTDCIWKHKWAIVGADTLGYFLWLAASAILIADSGPTSFIWSIIGSSLGSMLSVEKHCGKECVYYRGDLICDICPDSGMLFYDGANCYYGWPPGNTSCKFIYEPMHVFDYCAVPPGNSCPNGNFGGPFNNGGQGHWDSAHCIFSYYPADYQPFIYGGQYYLTSKCRRV